MQLYEKFCKALYEIEIDELGLLPMVPEMNELPLESQVYHPLVVFETKLGVAKSSLAELLKQSHQYFITLGKEDFVELEKVTRAMVLLKPDNYTAMNRRKELIVSGYIDPIKELALIDLIFTIPKHAKSSIAWYHRQWILANHDIQVCVQKEFQLCAKASSSYPRNYYAWTYRYWIVSSYCSSQTDKLLQEYNDTRRWIELNISDYSGFQYLQQLMTLLLPALNRDRHMDWVNSLVIKYPGHESLWCHKRYCSSIYIGSIDYCYSQHQFVHDIMNGRFRDQSLSDLAQDLTAQEEFALKFGLWQTLLEKKCHLHAVADTETVRKYEKMAPISRFLDRQEPQRITGSFNIKVNH